MHYHAGLHYVCTFFCTGISCHQDKFIVCKHTCNKALLILLVVFLMIFLLSCPSVYGFLLTGSQTSFDSMSDCLWLKRSYQEYTKTHVFFNGLQGLSIGVMVFILYKRLFLLSPQNSLCMIYKHFEFWGHWKCPPKIPFIPMSLYTFVSS